LPKLARLTASEAEKLLLKAGFCRMRTKGSHRIYFKNNIRMVLPFHAHAILHPKIVKQLEQAIDKAH
jgi:predicted RNA binding protein YcfA (HicA-like mRNA interferase family)